MSLQLLKEYITLLIEGSDAPKAVFMAGPPGAGKSSVIDSLGLSSRLKIINPDTQYEKALEAESIPSDRETLMGDYQAVKAKYKAAEALGDEEEMAIHEPEYTRLRGLMSRNMTLFTQARKQAKADQAAHIDAGEEFLVDGTGGNYKEIFKQVEQLRSVGYEVAMIYVDVPVEVSVERDKRRGESGGRRIGAEKIEKSWASVDRNKPLYKKLFGKNFIRVDATKEKSQKSLQTASRKISRFLG